jgi:hypothetical protein
MKRIRCDPAIQLGANLGQISRVTREQMRLRQNHQVLMPVQLPDDFVIARARRIQERNAPEIYKICLDPARVIAAPTDFGARFDGPAKDRESMPPDLIGPVHHLLRTVARGRQLQARNEIAAYSGRRR